MNTAGDQLREKINKLCEDHLREVDAIYERSDLTEMDKARLATDADARFTAARRKAASE